MGSRLGGRGDERRLAAAAGRAPVRRAASGEAAATVLPSRANAITATQGRWSTTALSSRASRIRARSQSCCSSARESSRAKACEAKGFPAATGPSTGAAKLETLGVCRRGYFVEGLGGAQFALPGAVERLRERPEEERRS